MLKDLLHLFNGLNEMTQSLFMEYNNFLLIYIKGNPQRTSLKINNTFLLNRACNTLAPAGLHLICYEETVVQSIHYLLLLAFVSLAVFHCSSCGLLIVPQFCRDNNPSY